MARTDPDEPLLMSVLDRLLTGDTPQGRMGRGQYLSALRRAVRRDLEALLNTRQRCLSWPADLEELATSSVAYGVPDFTAMNVASDTERDNLRASIEDLIRRFEPRFKTVSVSVRESTDTLDRTLRFRIDAIMHAEPMPEHLVFDSFVDPASRAVRIRED